MFIGLPRRANSESPCEDANATPCSGSLGNSKRDIKLDKLCSASACDEDAMFNRKISGSRKVRIYKPTVVAVSGLGIFDAGSDLLDGFGNELTQFHSNTPHVDATETPNVLGNRLAAGGAAKEGETE